MTYDDVTIENTPEQPGLGHSQTTHLYDGWTTRYGGLGLSGVIALPNTTFEDWLLWYRSWINQFSGVYNTTIEDIDKRLTEGEAHGTKLDDEIAGFDTRLTANEAHDLVQDQQISDLFASGWLVTPLAYGLVGDGIADDTLAVQAAVDAATSRGGGLILFPTAKHIRLTAPIISIGSNTTIDFNGSEVIWDGAVQNNVGRFTGMFNAKGSITGELYTATNVVLNTPGDNTDSQNYYEHDGYFSCDYASTFSVGDWVLFKINTGDYNPTALSPKDEKLVRITDIKQNQIFINYTSPFSYSGSYAATVQKVTPVQNIKFLNTKLNDKKIIYTAKDPNNSHPSVLTFVSGFSVQYATNVNFDQISAYNTKLPVLFINHVNTINVSRGTLDSAAIVGPGEGYYTQFNYATNITFSKGHAIKSRHLVDFTGSSFAKVSDCSGYRMYSMTYQLHGAYEHHIEYFNSQGTFNNGSGTLFGNANQFISFNKFQGWITSNGYSTDYVISDSDVKLMRAFTGLIVESSKVLLDLGNGSSPAYTPDTRETNKTYTVFNDSKVDIMASGQSGIIYNFDTFKFNNSVLRAKRDLSGLAAEGAFTVQFADVTNAIIAGAPEINRLKFRLQSSGGKKLIFTFLNNLMYCTASTYHITSQSLGTSTLTTFIDKNNFINSLTTGNKVNAVNLPSNTLNSGATQNIILTGNYFENATLLASKANSGDALISDHNMLKNSTYTIGSDIPHLQVNDLSF